MSKNGRTYATFNPEKFLAAEAKKKTAKAPRRRARRFRNTIVLTDEFQAALYTELNQKHSQLFRSDAGSEDRAGRAKIAAELLRKSLRREGVRLDEDIFFALFFHFFRGFLVHLERGNPDSPSPPGEKK